MVGRTFRIAAAGAAASLLLGAVASSAPSPRKRARAAVGYIVRHQEANGSVPSFSAIASTADGIVSMVAARRAPKAIFRAIQYLKNNETEIDRVGEKAKVIMALEAAGRNPRKFVGRNLVFEIRVGMQSDGRYGDLSQSYVFDQALSILALAAADGEIEGTARAWLQDAQCDDGGWQFDLPSSPSDDAHCYDSTVPPPGDFTTSDTNTTSYAIQAFAASGQPFLAPEEAYDFLDTARDPIKKGWVFAPQFACAGNQEPPDCSVTDANSTALVIQALVAFDQPVPENARRALRSLQYPLCGNRSGAFAVTWVDDDGKLRRSGPDVGATVGAVPGILEKALPIPPAEVTKPAPKPRSC